MALIGPRARGLFVLDGAARPDAVPESQGDDMRDVEAVLSGDREAYESLVRRHQGAVNRFMRHFARDARTREELVHDVFVEAYVSLHRYRAKGPFLHWLCKIASRTGYRHWRRTSTRLAREVSLEETTAGVGACDNRAERRSTNEQVRLFLEALPPRDRLVLTMLYLEGLDAREAARVLGWSHTMVRVQSYRARAKLRGLLEKAQWRETHE